jgi:hypothetical protein
MKAQLIMQGALAAGCWASGLFFLRFWRSANDRLFLFFALAFVVLGAHWLVIGLSDMPSETRYFLYLPRLGAFVLIVVGIVDKNQRARRSR